MEKYWWCRGTVCQTLMENNISFFYGGRKWVGKWNKQMIHLSVGCKTSVKHRKWCSVILNDWTINISWGLSLTRENSQISCRLQCWNWLVLLLSVGWEKWDVFHKDLKETPMINDIHNKFVSLALVDVQIQLMCI